MWSPATPLDVIQRWGAVALTADQEITEADYRAADRFDGTPLLARIKAPTLILAGEDDRLTPPAVAEVLRQGIAGARAVVVPDAGHMLAQERPEPFYAELEAFLTTATS
jgi:pimeloyl-ACP methyl ester carboxylesterase